jgi:RHS repeat-associated protein
MHSVSLKFLVGILSFSDYYPFGMQMVGRNASSDSYRFGFNGAEKDDEIRSNGNALEFGDRSIYDARLGRFASIDPMIREFPFMSTYSFAANNPILYIDAGGAYPDIPDLLNPFAKMMELSSRQSAHYAATNIGCFQGSSEYNTVQFGFANQVASYGAGAFTLLMGLAQGKVPNMMPSILIDLTGRFNAYDSWEEMMLDNDPGTFALISFAHELMEISSGAFGGDAYDAGRLTAEVVLLVASAGRLQAVKALKVIGYTGRAARKIVRLGKKFTSKLPKYGISYEPVFSAGGLGGFKVKKT